jgi:hypothetical protein
VKKRTTKTKRRKALREVKKVLAGVKRFAIGGGGAYHLFVPDPANVPSVVRARIRKNRLPAAMEAHYIMESVKAARAS